jgi:hypothetical protein
MHRPELRLDRADLGARYLKRLPDLLTAFRRHIEAGAGTWPYLQLRRAHLEPEGPANFLPAVVTFLQQHYNKNLTAEHLDIFFGNATALAHIWTRDGEIVAFIGGIIETIAVCGLSAPRLVVNFLCIAPELRGQGLVRYIDSALSLEACERALAGAPADALANTPAGAPADAPKISVLSVYHTSVTLASGFSTTPNYTYPVHLEALRRKGAWGAARPAPCPRAAPLRAWARALSTTPTWRGGWRATRPSTSATGTPRTATGHPQRPCVG